MKKRLSLIISVVTLIGIVYANVFYPRLYVQGFYPLINNKVVPYKIDKGMNLYRAKPYEINTFAPETKEKIDFAEQRIIISTQIGNTKIAPDYAISFDGYIANMQKKVFRQSMKANILAPSSATQTAVGGLIREFSLDLPKIAVPRAVQKVLGSKAGKLNLDGTQKITLQASSTKRKQVPIYETSRRSTFDLKMEQETNLRLTGTIGEKIAVNMKYNSKQDEQFFDPNNINVKYSGTEDEVLQSIEAGNISLSLSGSRYISYSTSSQGLFGITTKMKYRDLNLTMIASKEEGQKNTQSYIGQSQADSTIFRSRDYAPRNMYFLDDPNELFAIFGEEDMGDLIPLGWKNNAIKTDPTGAWYSKFSDLRNFPANGTVKLFIDDANASNNVGSAIGDTIFFSSTDFYVPYYDELVEGTDFITNYDSGFIQVLKPIDRRTTLAVQYTRRDGVKVPANADVQDGKLHAKPIRRRNQEFNPDDPNNVWHYQMRNVYNMNKTNIKSEGFLLDIYTEDVDRTRNYNVPDSLVTSASGIITYNDYLRLDSNGDGQINGDDSTVNLASGLIYFPFLEPFKPLGDDIIYEFEHESINYQDIKFFMAVKGKIGREAIELSQGGLLKGSVRVRVNGKTMRENIDYLVDYDLGRITFLTAAGKDPEAKIEIDYEFRSMFDIAKKSLAGIRADWNITNDAKLGGTLIYRSENVNDKRPKIGNENIEMIMGDVDGSLTVKPKFVTTWLDALPLINTNAESRFTLSGELAFTMPNVYGDPEGKKNLAYIDDMESIVDQYPLGVTFSTWSLGSKPFNTSLAKGRTIWYNPKNIKREQIEDAQTLTAREKEENVTVLALKVFPNSLNMPGSNLWSYGGIMKYVGNQIDFSQKKYIELLVKLDTKPGEPVPNPVLRIDLGDINEDFYTEFGGLNKLNSEDKNNDGVLTIDEDIGLDGIKFGEPGHDPNDKADTNVDQYGDYPNINGTEENRILDTEDLDGDGVLDQLDRYFSYAVAIGDTISNPYMIGSPNRDKWVLFRIPINDATAYQVVNSSATGTPPSLKKISYARIWIETDATAKVLIAEADIVGNKWEDFHVRNEDGAYIPPSEYAQYNTSFISGIINNQKNRPKYVSPPGTVYIEERKESSESALTLGIDNLPAGNQVLLRQRMLDSYSLLSYDKIKFWVYPELDEGGIYPDSLDIIFRMGADSLNYYQVHKRVRTNANFAVMQKDLWTEVTYNLQDISKLKEKFPNDTLGEEQIGDTMYKFRGRPNLTNIRELGLGVMNPRDLAGTPQMYSGTIYFNDIRVADPFEDMGWARRLTLNSVFADVMTLDVDYEHKSENFNPNIQRGRQNTFTENRSLNITNKYFVNKLFPNSWSLDIPISLYRNYSIGIPRYRANSDLLRKNIINPIDSLGVEIDEIGREINETLLYAADFGFSQRTAPKNKILLYTINKLALSGRIENGYRNMSTTRDTTFTWRGTLNYNLSFPAEKTSFALFNNYRLGWFPTSWNNSFTLNSLTPKSYNWEKRGESFNWYARTQSVPTKVLQTDNNMNWNLTSDLAATIRYNTKRDLMQKNYYQDVNIGRETEFVQDLGLNFNPSYFPRVFSLTASGSTKFSDFQKRYSQTVEGEQQDFFQRDGNNNRTFRANLTLQNSTLLNAWAQSLDNAHQSKARQGTSDTKESESKDDDKAFSEPKQEDRENEIKEDFGSIEKKDGSLEDDLKKKDEMSEEYKEKYQIDPNLEPKKEGDENNIPEYKDEQEKQEAERGGKVAKDSPSNLYLPGLMVSYLARLKNISTSYQNTYTMNYTRKDERPPFAFQIGLPHSVSDSFLDSRSNDNTFTVGSGFTFSRNLDSIINYSYSINKRYSSASNQSVAQTFPDVMISLIDFEKWVGLSKVLSSSRINSGIQYNVRQNGDIDFLEPKQETKTLSFNPLMGLSTNILSVITTNVSLSMSSAENRTQMADYNIFKNMESTSIVGNFSYSYREGRGFTIPFTERKIHIKNELTSSLSVQYEQNFDETIGRESTLVDRDTSKISFSPSATYQFDQNIKGGLTSSYELTTDKKRDDGTRTFRLGVWVEIAL